MKPIKAGMKRWRWVVFIMLQQEDKRNNDSIWCNRLITRPEVSLVGDDALCELAHMDKEQQEGEDPPQVMAGKMKPGVVMDLDLGRLAAPTWHRDQEEDNEMKLKPQTAWNNTNCSLLWSVGGAVTTMDVKFGAELHESFSIFTDINHLTTSGATAFIYVFIYLFNPVCFWS